MSLTIEPGDASGSPEASATESGFAVRARDVSVFHGTRAAVTDVSFEIPAGSSVAVIGPNGSGKSTLLGTIAGLHDVRAGTLEVPARNRLGGVALVLQGTDVDRSLPITVRETVQMARYPRLGLLHRARRSDRDAVRRALERVDMVERQWSQLSELSGGQRQRVLVAQGLAQQADLLLMDEPLTGLDLPSAGTISDVIGEERAAGRSVVFSTHDLADAAGADLVLLLATRQVAFGPPREVLAPSALAEAFGGAMLHVDGGHIVLDDPHRSEDPEPHRERAPR